MLYFVSSVQLTSVLYLPPVFAVWNCWAMVPRVALLDGSVAISAVSEGLITIIIMVAIPADYFLEVVH